jgi:hypothetical protein
LKPRRRVRQRVAAVEPEPVALPDADARDEPLEVAIADGVERLRNSIARSGAGFEDEIEVVGSGSPDAEPGAGAFGKGAEAREGVHDVGTC